MMNMAVALRVAEEAIEAISKAKPMGTAWYAPTPTVSVWKVVWVVSGCRKRSLWGRHRHVTIMN